MWKGSPCRGQSTNIAGVIGRLHAQLGRHSQRTELPPMILPATIGKGGMEQAYKKQR